jgi:cardiolipin synthase
MWLSILLHVGIIAGVLAGFLLIGHILRQRRPPATSLGWILFVIFIPYLGIPFYLALGTRKLSDLSTAKARLFETAQDTSPTAGSLAVERVLAVAGIPAASAGNQVLLHADGVAACEALLALIDSAQQELAVCTFILGNDSFGERIIERLAARAEQGVQVRLLLDGVGSFLLPRTRLAHLQQAGGKVAWFIPVIHRPFRGRTNLRNHRKYAVADRQWVWAGGRNLAGEYFEPDTGTGEWIDLSYDLGGPAAGDFQHIFEADWNFATRQQLPAASAANRPTETGDGRVQVVPAGPDIGGEPLRDILLTACFQASRRILAVTPYYVPDEGLQEALCLAAKRGVAVDIILPMHSNHRLADLARRRYLDELANAGARIWLVPDAMVHAKAIVFDETLALAGSANLDRRSLFLNFEVMSLFLDKPEIATLETWLASLRQRGRQLVPEQRSALRESLEGLVLLLAYQL